MKKMKKPETEKKQEYGNCMFMLPGKVSAKELMDSLTFLNPDALEIWVELNLLEITLKNGTLTFEDMMDTMSVADAVLLKGLKTEQVYACDYDKEDKEEVQKILSFLIDKFHGFLASDTEDFKPFIRTEEL